MRLLSSLLLALLLTVVFAPMSSAKAPVNGSSAYFESWDDSGCVVTYASFWAGAGRNGEPFMELDDLVVEDTCTGGAGPQRLVNVYASTNDFSIKTDGHLRQATITATIPVDFCSGSMCDLVGQSLQVNLFATGTGDLTGDHNGLLRREAVVTGSITDQSGQNYTPLPADGYLTRDKR